MKSRIPQLIDSDNIILLTVELACALGLNEALAIQQVHYYAEINRKAKKESSHYFDDRWWVYHTWSSWRDEKFCFWSARTIKRTFDNLLERELVFRKPHDNQKNGFWWSVNYDKLHDLLNDETTVTPGKLSPVADDATPDKLSPIDSVTPDKLSPQTGQVVTPTGNTESTENTTTESKTDTYVSTAVLPCDEQTLVFDGAITSAIKALGVQRSRDIASVIKTHLETGVIPKGNEYQRKNYRAIASAILDAGITVQQVKDYVTHLKAQPFWKDKIIKLDYIRENIMAWVKSDDAQTNDPAPPLEEYVPQNYETNYASKMHALAEIAASRLSVTHRRQQQAAALGGNNDSA